MKIVHLIDSLGTGGAQDVVKQIVQKGRGRAEFTVIAAHPGERRHEAALREAGVQIHYLLPSLKHLFLNLPGACLRLRKLLRALDPDILHMHLEASMVLGVLTSPGLRARRVLSLYAWRQQQPGWVNPAMRLLLLRIDAVVCNGLCMAPFIPREKYHEAVWGIDENALLATAPGIESEFGLQGRGPFLFAVGRHHPDKRLDLAAGVLAEVLKSEPRAFLFLITNAEGPELEKLRISAEEAGVAGSVAFPGYREDLASFFALKGFFLRLSKNESGNLSMTLAQGMGCIPAGFEMTKVLDVPELDAIKSGLNGILVPQGETAAMAACIVEVWRNPELLKHLSRANVEYVYRERLTETSLMKPLFKAYETILHGGVSKSGR